MEVAGAPQSGRRRPQCAVLTDDRARPAAAGARRAVRADRVSGRHARNAAAQSLDDRLQPARGVYRTLPQTRQREDDGGTTVMQRERHRESGALRKQFWTAFTTRSTSVP